MAALAEGVQVVDIGFNEIRLSKISAGGLGNQCAGIGIFEINDAVHMGGLVMADQAVGTFWFNSGHRMVTGLGKLTPHRPSAADRQTVTIVLGAGMAGLAGRRRKPGRMAVADHTIRIRLRADLVMIVWVYFRSLVAVGVPFH